MGRRTKNNKEDETKQKRGKGLSGKKQKEYEDPDMKAKPRNPKRLKNKKKKQAEKAKLEMLEKKMQQVETPEVEAEDIDSEEETEGFVDNEAVENNKFEESDEACSEEEVSDADDTQTGGFLGNEEEGSDDEEADSDDDDFINDDVEESGEESDTDKLFGSGDEDGEDMQLMPKDDLESDSDEETEGVEKDDEEDSELDSDFSDDEDEVQPRELARPSLSDSDDENVEINLQKSEVITLPSGQKIEKFKNEPLEAVKERIEHIIKALSDWNKYGDKTKKRKDVVAQLIDDLCIKYGYNEFLMQKFFDMIPLPNLIQFLDANDARRPITIRTNTLKTNRRELITSLVSKSVTLEKIEKWSKVGIVLYEWPNNFTPGASLEYLSGRYMLQGASSFTPVMSLAPQPSEKILDMCCAPGGKTTYIAQLMKNKGQIVANDINKDRLKSVKANMHRMGVANAVVTNYDARSFPAVMGSFDRVLLDAPCSGTGVISKDPAVKSSKGDEDIQRCSHMQKELILSAIDSVDAKSKTGGYIIYCTCSLLVEENEDVVDYALKKRNVKLVPTGLGDLGTDGFTKYRQYRFNQKLSLTKRFYPHVHNMDGFYVAKLKKLSNELPPSEANSQLDENDQVVKPDGSNISTQMLKRYQKKKRKAGALVRPLPGLKAKKRQMKEAVEGKKNGGKSENGGKTENGKKAVNGEAKAEGDAKKGKKKFKKGKKRKGDNKENGEAANKKAKTENAAKPAENGAKSEGDAKSPKKKFKKAKKGKKSKVSKEGKSEGDKTPSAEGDKTPSAAEVQKSPAVSEKKKKKVKKTKKVKKETKAE